MKKLFFTLTIFFSLGLTATLMAQPPDPGGGGGDEPGCYPPPCIPIDGGMSWLLVAGVAYGGKKIYDMQYQEKEES